MQCLASEQGCGCDNVVDARLRRHLVALLGTGGLAVSPSSSEHPACDSGLRFAICQCAVLGATMRSLRCLATVYGVEPSKVKHTLDLERSLSGARSANTEGSERNEINNGNEMTGLYTQIMAHVRKFSIPRSWIAFVLHYFAQSKKHATEQQTGREAFISSRTSMMLPSDRGINSLQL